jgi:hypothetical protein
MSTPVYGRTIRVEAAMLVEQLTFHPRPAYFIQEVSRRTWGGRIGIVRYTGPCLGCSRTTWQADGDHNDCRGPLGNHALWTMEAKKGDLVAHLRLCSECANNQDAYDRAVKQLHLYDVKYVSPWRCVLPGEA